jgi:hypothetical protein
MSPGEVEVVVCVAPFGGGAGIPTDGTSPAKADAERTQLRVIAIANRFMDVSPFEV